MLVLQKLKEYAKTGRTALVNRDKQLPYQELDARSDAFADYLLRQFGDSRTPVVICGDKETDFLCCLLGALKAGRAYVPIDSVLPDDRAAQIIADVQPCVVVDFTGRKLAGSRLDGETLAEVLNRVVPPVSPEHWVTGQGIAYILFTSGSTGRPKGVPITAANLETFCAGVLPFYLEEWCHPQPSVLLLRCVRLRGLCGACWRHDPIRR